MSVNVTIDASQKVVLVALTGEIKDADLIEIPAATKAHPEFDPSFSEIVDFSAVTGGKISTFAVQTLAQRASIYNRASRHVVIAPQAHGFGLTRMYQVYARETRPNMEVVHTLEQALKCLGLDSGTKEPR
ncbi:MAG TPA: hypothetical protein VFM77_16990 [Terriglobales bacterium]|nr:hypothetical protein [Terriglobales bacterium]